MTDEGQEVSVSLESFRCKGCEACADLLPEIFGWDAAAEKAYLKQGSGPLDALRQCAVICPSHCIEIEEK